MRTFLFTHLFCAIVCVAVHADERIATKKLDDAHEDPAAEMVAGIDRFLLEKLEQAAERQSDHWQTADQFEDNRKFLAECLGLAPDRHPADEGVLQNASPLATVEGISIDRIRWPVLSSPAPQTRNSVGLWGEGIHLRPDHSIGKLLVIVPDADENPEDWLPESVVGETDDPAWRQSCPSNLAAAGVDVIIMATTSREIHQHGRSKMSRREYLHRAAFELGRTLTGYEVQTVEALIDRFATHQSLVVGVGEGAMTALIAAAVDDRISEIAISGYLGGHREIWSGPLSRQVFGLYNRFDDGHLLALVAPRRVLLFDDKVYVVDLPGEGGAPAKWASPSAAEISTPLRVCETACERVGTKPSLTIATKRSMDVAPIHGRWKGLADVEVAQSPREFHVQIDRVSQKKQKQQRNDRIFDSIDAYNQMLLAECEYERREYLNIGNARDDRSDAVNHIDTSSTDAYSKSIERFRSDFRDNVIGWFDDQLLELNARSQPSLQGERWTGHEVYLDVFPEVFAYGILLLPNDLKPDENRPVVVCQHGLEGRPQDTIAGDHRAYHDFAAKLAEMGYVVFAPQNPYIGKDDFRTLQRKAYPIGKTLFSIIGAQHQQIIRYLKTIPGVDPDRIAFYGLSYGGKSAMRLPALLPEYCLSICSADFNDWVWKNASSRSRYSYIGTGEYEIFEFGLGKKYNYAEMAALIAPRPFMVERGHHDGVAPDWRVASEFAKVRYLYQARLKFPPGQCEIEFFDGPHTINGKGTFEFLRRHLRYSPQQNRQ